MIGGYTGYVVGDYRTKVLCYADDVLVFIHDIQDLGRLKSVMNIYYNASDAKFNNDKVQTFPISGRDTWDYWEPLFSRLQIKHLFLVEDEIPLIYPGFPLI